MMNAHLFRRKERRKQAPLVRPALSSSSLSFGSGRTRMSRAFFVTASDWHGKWEADRHVESALH